VSAITINVPSNEDIDIKFRVGYNLKPNDVQDKAIRMMAAAIVQYLSEDNLDLFLNMLKYELSEMSNYVQKENILMREDTAYCIYERDGSSRIVNRRALEDYLDDGNDFEGGEPDGEDQTD